MKNTIQNNKEVITLAADLNSADLIELAGSLQGLIKEKQHQEQAAYLDHEFANAELCELIRNNHDAEYESEWYDIAWSVDPLSTDPAFPYDASKDYGSRKLVYDILHNPEGSTSRKTIQAHHDKFKHLSNSVCRHALDNRFKY